MTFSPSIPHVSTVIFPILYTPLSLWNRPKTTCAIRRLVPPRIHTSHFRTILLYRFFRYLISSCNRLLIIVSSGSRTFRHSASFGNHAFRRSAPSGNHAFWRSAPSGNHAFRHSASSGNHAFWRSAPSGNRTFWRSAPSGNHAFQRSASFGASFRYTVLIISFFSSPLSGISLPSCRSRARHGR